MEWHYETIVDPGVYNGIVKTQTADEMFMTSVNISRCIGGLKLKNT